MEPKTALAEVILLYGFSFVIYLISLVWWGQSTIIRSKRNSGDNSREFPKPIMFLNAASAKLTVKMLKSLLPVMIWLARFAALGCFLLATYKLVRL